MCWCIQRCHQHTWDRTFGLRFLLGFGPHRHIVVSSGMDHIEQIRVPRVALFSRIFNMYSIPTEVAIVENVNDKNFEVKPRYFNASLDHFLNNDNQLERFLDGGSENETSWNFYEK